MLTRILFKNINFVRFRFPGITFGENIFVK